ncbi:putative holin-like toxin [Paenibacillus sp. GCM10027627]
MQVKSNETAKLLLSFGTFIVMLLALVVAIIELADK